MHGIVRRSVPLTVGGFEHLIQNPSIYGKKLFLYYADLGDDASTCEIFCKN